MYKVALLAEGVDRNPATAAMVTAPDVALLAEGVDRNRFMWNGMLQGKRSPSSRRAWIEICPLFHQGEFAEVALLAEGVDRNS